MRKSPDAIFPTVNLLHSSPIIFHSIISGAFYLQNIYHSTDDLTTVNHALRFLDSYARTTLIDYQQYRRSCLRDDHLHLAQIHQIYQASIFQGYSFLYQFRDGEQVELFIKLNLLTAIRSNYVKRFEVNFLNPHG